MDHRYEAARCDAPHRQFDTLREALDYITASRVDSTRPWVRVVNGSRVTGTLLVVSGYKLNELCAQPLPQLPPEDQAMLNAWSVRRLPDAAAASQHKFTGIVASTGRYVRVLAGYDKPRGKFFLTVFHGVSIPGDGVLLASEADAEQDWGSSDAVFSCLGMLGVRVPETFMRALIHDQEVAIRHRMVEHHFDAPPSVLVA